MRIFDSEDSDDGHYVNDDELDDDKEDIKI